MEYSTVKHTIEPIFDSHSEILILGTMPSPKSRETGFYYGHPRNRFWVVMANLFNEPVPTTNNRKIDLLLRHHIALWDVLAQCDISGASDTSITNARANDLSRITNSANIKAVFCTGSKSAELYRRLCEKTTKKVCMQLPSTSPANAAWNVDKLTEAYREILPYLTPEPPQVLDVPEVISLEQEIAAKGTSLSELMERAGLWIAYKAHTLKPEGNSVILCGNGNNGGDGWVAARHLAQWGHNVTLVCAKDAVELRAEPARASAMSTVEYCGHSHKKTFELLVLPEEKELEIRLNDADIVIDALLGTGFTGVQVKEPFASWISITNARHNTKTTVIAADVPSGLNAQTGTAAHTTIYADETVTMIAYKTGLFERQALQFTGNVTLAPLAYVQSSTNEL